MNTAVLRGVLLAVICLVYVVIVIVTSRGFIAAPLRRVLLCRAEDQALAVGALEERRQVDPGTSVAARSTKAVVESLTEARSWLRIVSWPFDTPLTKLYAETLRLDSAEQAMVDLVPDEELSGYAAAVLDRLAAESPTAANALRRQLDAATTGGDRRFIVRRAVEVAQQGPQRTLGAGFESQRVALWLGCTGLLGVLGVGLFSPSHMVSLLFGALGGFLAPIVRISVGQRASSWGVMVLSPVGGALTAVGGLLLVRLLADQSVNVLGAVFRDNSWNDPATPLALALALLFGFSGRLFSRLAIAGTAQLSGNDGKPGRSGSE